METVTAEYDGCSDSGQIDEPVFAATKGSARVASDISTTVQDFFYDQLEERYGGWEINEGSYGRFEWSINDDHLSLHHSARTEHYEETTL